MKSLVIAVVAALTVSGTAVAAPVPDPFVDVIVVLKSQAAPTVSTPDRRERLRQLEKALRAHADATQRGARDLLAVRRKQGLVTSVVPLWITNAIGARVRTSVAVELARRPEILEVRPSTTIQAPSVAVTAEVEPNIAQVNAPALWGLGYRGQGMVVASMDTGVDIGHPELAARWRGGSNSWYDPNGQHPGTPIDLIGHGTQTMGVIVGGDSGGTSIGVAPDARWIAVKIFNDRGQASSTAIHLGYQWLLDPDGNPATADAPNVVNNSWTMSAGTCSLEFQPDLRNLRTAGILPVFAAGNYGPTAGTSASPANNPDALAVGSVDGNGLIDPYSSRGPSACTQDTYPQLVAPGTDIRTTDLYGGYLDVSGTSLAAPHVSGALALLLQASPGISADRQQTALRAGAVDLGPAGPDNDYGSGRLDVLASYNWLRSTPDFGLAVTPAAISIQPGETATYAVTVTSSGGFAGDVALSLSGLPAGATANFNPPVVVGGAGSAVLTVAGALSSGSLVVTGSSGSSSHSATASLTVVPPPDYSLAATPSTRTVNAGSSTAYTVSISPANGFAGDVTLTAAGLPATMGNAVFSPAIVHGSGTAQLTVTTSATAPAGSYPMTVTGTSGTLSHSVTVTLVINQRDFAVTMSPASVTVTRPQTATYAVTVSSVGGFSGSVTMKVSGLPSNSTATWTGNPVAAPGTATLKIKTTSGTTRGTLTVKVTAISGSMTHQTTATLTVR